MGCAGDDIDSAWLPNSTCHDDNPTHHNHHSAHPHNHGACHHNHWSPTINYHLSITLHDHDDPVGPDTPLDIWDYRTNVEHAGYVTENSDHVALGDICRVLHDRDPETYHSATPLYERTACLWCAVNGIRNPVAGNGEQDRSDGGDCPTPPVDRLPAVDAPVTEEGATS